MSKHAEVKHQRRNMWGHIVLPGNAYRNFRGSRANGFYHPRYKWKNCCKAYRKKIRKMKIARYSRKGMRKRIKRAR
jgi:hypothetical protein